MEIVLYVHDLYPEIGHSHAMIETLKHFPRGAIDKLTVVAFESAELDKLFPELAGKCYFKKVPGKKLTPFLIKLLFYQIYCLVYSYFKVAPKALELSIGIAHLRPQFVNVQFLHFQWAKHYFSMEKMPLYKLIYKKIFFYCLQLGEQIVYGNPKTKVGALSFFVQQALIEKYNRNSTNTHLTYSGINIHKFAPDLRPRREIWAELASLYPAMSKINPDKPIALFVGAMERKGLPHILKRLEKDSSSCYQLIVVGRPETGSQIDLSLYPGIAHIPYTKELPKFYSLADQFLFPTLYEPFGLVIIEAAIMGLEVYTLKNEVGAVELLVGLPHINVADRIDNFDIPKPRLLSIEEKLQLREERLKRLTDYSWSETGKSFYRLLNSSTTPTVGAEPDGKAK